MKKTVLLLFGGAGAEHAISSASAYSILGALKDLDYQIYAVGITKDGAFYLYDGDRERIRDATWSLDITHLTPTFPVRIGTCRGILIKNNILPCDVAIPVLHGDRGEDGLIQGLLDTVGIPFVGAQTKCGAIANDKVFSKILAEHLGIPTVPWCSFEANISFPDALFTARAVCGSDYPYFIKPTSLGSSIGASVVHSDEEFREGLRVAGAYGDILIERYIPHPRELEVAYFDAGGKPVLSPIGEVISEYGFYDYREKYETGTAKISVAKELPSEIEGKIYRYATAIARLLGIRDLARIDFFLDENEKLYFNEINPFPGFTNISLYPVLMDKAGFDYKSLLCSMIEAAYDRGI